MAVPTSAPPAPVPAEHTLTRLATSLDGLSTAEAQSRLSRFGPNA